MNSVNELLRNAILKMCRNVTKCNERNEGGTFSSGKHLAELRYHARDERQWAGVVPHGHKLITSGQIPVQGDVGSDVLPAVHGGVCPALAMDGGL